jgi:hypothetical protein
LSTNTEAQETGVTTLISSGRPYNGDFSSRFIGDVSIDFSGKYVDFTSDDSKLVNNDRNNSTDIFLFDSKDSNLKRVSVANDGFEGNDNSSRPSVSSNGRLVISESESTNLIPSDRNGDRDIFIQNILSGET